MPTKFILCLQINFLMVGHTHEDIDGLFGILASKLMNLCAYTTQEMNALFSIAGRSASTIPQRGQGCKSSVGIDNGFLPDDTEESRH